MDNQSIHIHLYHHQKTPKNHNEDGRYPFFIRVDGKLAGLVLVRSCSEHNNLSNPHNIAEFFVMKKYRRKGVGKVKKSSRPFFGMDGNSFSKILTK